MAHKDAASGKAQIYPDGVLKATIDLYSSSVRDKVFVYMPAVPYGPHTVRTCTKNALSTGTSISINGFAFVR